MTRPGTSERPLRVAIVGAGPSGFYTAQALLADDDVHVDIDLLDRLPAPFGLVRYGVAPDHQKIKAVSRVFDKLCRDERLRFLGNVDFGRDVTHTDLARHYDQVVYAVGGQSDRRLGIPGEDLEGSYSSTELVAWYSGHPDFLDLPVDLSRVRRVAVVGVGNVAMDVARILARTPEDLGTTDISDEALEVLRSSAVEEIHVLGRRGPVQAKFSPPEVKELGEIEGTAVVVEPGDLDLDAASREALEEDRTARRNLEQLEAYADQPPEIPRRAERRIHLRFLVSPLEILENGEEAGRVGGVRLGRNRLEPTDSGYLQAVATGEDEVLPVEMVVKAVGYRSVALPGVPFDERRGLIPNDEGRVLDPETGEPRPGEYAVGWVKRGPSGLIGSNKPDGAETAAAMLADLPSLDAADDAAARRSAVDALLAEREVRVVDYESWCRLDALEVERGAPHGRPRVKFLRVEEMLAALEEAAVDAAV